MTTAADGMPVELYLRLPPRHSVVAVDESSAMLAHVHGVETVQARIEDLALEHAAFAACC